MHSALAERLRCPSCRCSLELDVDLIFRETGRIAEGRLLCASCQTEYPITRGIPRFVEAEGYVASFGRQWTRYTVEQPSEDEDVFQAKTGFTFSELAERDLLDAGCGGGRYSLVAARKGARVLAVDMSDAIDRAARLCAGFPNVDFMQADLLRLPLAANSVHLAFSMGVLHHSNDPAAAFQQVAATVRPGGRLAVWLYRRNTLFQEAANQVLRGITRRMDTPQLENIATLGAVLGSMPIINRTLNKVINFSNHPVWENRVCDTFDWYSPEYQSHHTVCELRDWFRSAGFGDLHELAPQKVGRLYRWAYEHNLIVGSGVNVVGTKLSQP